MPTTETRPGFPRNVMNFTGERIAEVFNSRRVPVRQLKSYQLELQKEGTDQGEINYRSAQWLVGKAKTLNMNIRSSSTAEDISFLGDTVELFRGDSEGQGIFLALYFIFSIRHWREIGKRKGVLKLLNEYLPRLRPEQRNEINILLSTQNADNQST